jgi:hypothetical protein
MATAQKKSPGEFLVDIGLVFSEQLRQAETEAKAETKSLRNILTKPSYR